MDRRDPSASPQRRRTPPRRRERQQGVPRARGFDPPVSSQWLASSRLLSSLVCLVWRERRRLASREPAPARRPSRRAACRVAHTRGETSPRRARPDRTAAPPPRSACCNTGTQTGSWASLRSATSTSPVGTRRRVRRQRLMRDSAPEASKNYRPRSTGSRSKQKSRLAAPQPSVPLSIQNLSRSCPVW